MQSHHDPIRRFRRRRLTIAAALAIAALPLAASQSALAIDFDINPLTNNSFLDFNPQISGTNIVWESPGDPNSSDREIQFYDGNTITPLTTNTYGDFDPQISGNNVTWWAQNRR